MKWGNTVSNCLNKQTELKIHASMYSYDHNCVFWNTLNSRICFSINIYFGNLQILNCNSINFLIQNLGFLPCLEIITLVSIWCGGYQSLPDSPNSFAIALKLWFFNKQSLSHTLHCPFISLALEIGLLFRMIFTSTWGLTYLIWMRDLERKNIPCKHKILSYLISSFKWNAEGLLNSDILIQRGWGANCCGDLGHRSSDLIIIYLCIVFIFFC
jgi:hypothetical protein